jgi:hypothetical protein
MSLVFQCVNDALKYNISPSEYFQFRFYEKRPDEKEAWAGTGYMYEFQRVMNPPEYRSVLDDKRQFYEAYKPYFRHRVFNVDQMEADETAFDLLTESAAGKLVIKASHGKCGAQVEILDAGEWSRMALVNRMRSDGFDMAEQFIVQHPEMARLSPSAVNTVRIITQLNSEDEVEILGCRQRISVDSPVDNMAAGNLAAPIEQRTGVISGPGVYSDIRKSDETTHPVTGTPIVGFQVPFWAECLDLARSAALHDMRNRSIGWDIVITEQGPSLIEGNHDWCKLVWQMPVRRGLKSLLDKHWVEFVNRDSKSQTGK